MPEIYSLTTEPHDRAVIITFSTEDVRETLSVLHGVGSGSDAVNPRTARLRGLLESANAAFTAVGGAG